MWEESFSIKKCTFGSSTLYFVGVSHRSIRSAELAKKVIQSASPQYICIESCPERYREQKDNNVSFGFASSRALSYAKSTKKKCFLIDDCLSGYKSVISNVGNQNVPQPNSNGEFNKEDITKFRKELKNSDSQVYNKLITQRERNIAGRIRYVVNRVNGIFVVILGAAHIQEVPRLVRSVDEVELSNSRIIS